MMNSRVALILGVLAIALANASFLGLKRKRFSVKPDPPNQFPLGSSNYERSGISTPLTQQAQAPLCCQSALFTDLKTGITLGAIPAVDIRSPIRRQNNPLYSMDDYRVLDSGRGCNLLLFDPEDWVATYPNAQFPLELDIPFGWSIYNPVTTQPPLPKFSEQELRTTQYTGYYYACPSSANPFAFSWYFRNTAISPCKWILFQAAVKIPQMQPGGFPIPFGELVGRIRIPVS